MLGFELNNSLRGLVNKLIEAGWIKTTVGKVLLGNNGQAHMNHWLKSDNGKTNDFGIKPLERIGGLLEYEAHIVYVAKTDNDFKNELDSRNIQFIQNLETAMRNYLSENLPSPRITRSGGGKIDKVLDELIGL